MLFIGEGLLSLALSATPCGRNSDERILQLDSDCKELIWVNSDQAKMPTTVISSTLQAALAEDLASVRQVRDVLIENVKGALLVWIVVDDPERQVRDKIFQKQLDLMDAFPKIDFDFNLIPSMGRPVSEITTDARSVYSRPN